MHDRQSQMGVDEPDLGEVEIERRQDRLIRDHDRREKDQEGDLLAAHGEAGEPVARGRGDRQARGDHNEGDESGVADIGRQARLEAKDLRVVLETQRARQIVRRRGGRVGRGLDRGERRENDRRAHDRDHRNRNRRRQIGRPRQPARTPGGDGGSVGSERGAGHFASLLAVSAICSVEKMRMMSVSTIDSAAP